MFFRSSVPDSPRPRRGFRVRLKVLVALVVAVGALYGVMGRLGGPQGTQSFAGVVPSVTLTSSSGQAANRLAIDTSALHVGDDLVVPVKITNAGNQALKGVLAAMVTVNPGIDLSVESVPVGPASSVEYRLRLTQINALARRPDQIVVAFTPKS